MPKLTKRLCEQAPVGLTWDSELPGFGLRVLATGRRSFVVRYRTAAGTDRLVTLGTLAEFHPDEAREKARDVKRAARDGRDPKQERTAARNAPRLADLRDRLLGEHGEQRRPATRKGYDEAFRLHILPTLGNLPVADLTDLDILRLRRAMADKPIAFNRVLATLRKGLNLAERWRWRPVHSNPCKWVEPYPENPRERILEPAEVAAIWQALDAPDLMPSARALFRLLMLTGLRLSEWRLALWSWLDEPRHLLRIPDAGSKTGARDVPLADDVMAMLGELPRSSVFILPGLTGGPMSGHQKVWRRVCSAAGVAGVRIHDLRHTVGSYAHAAGATQRDIADLLGHRQLSTTERYINSRASMGHANATRATATIMQLTKRTGAA
jgi:integrase